MHVHFDVRLYRNVPSMIIAAVMVVPLIYVFTNAAQVDYGIWQRLWQTRVPGLLVNSLMLTLTT